jgi:sugar lactone lactonase YvrE
MGSGYLVVFPADGYSRHLLGGQLSYTWTLAFDNDRSRFSYMAETDGKLTIQFDFDLDK